MYFDEFCDDVGDDKRVVGFELFNGDGVVCDAFVVGDVDELGDKFAFFLEHERGCCEFVDDVYVKLFA